MSRNWVVVAAIAGSLLAAEARAGELYASVGHEGSYNTFSDLVRIDPETGRVTTVGRISGGDVGSVMGMAYDSRHDVLYVTASDHDPIPTGYLNRLYQVDRTTARATLVGSTEMPFVSGLAYDSKNDVLYGDGGDHPRKYLVTIDRATGAATRVGNAVVNSSALEYLPASDRLVSIDVPFDPPRSTLWDINRATGVGT